LIKLYYKKSKLNQQSKLFEYLGVDPKEYTYLNKLFNSQTNKENVSQFFNDSLNKQIFADFLKEGNFLTRLVLGLENDNKMSAVRQNVARSTKNSRSKAITKPKKSKQTKSKQVKLWPI